MHKRLIALIASIAVVMMGLCVRLYTLSVGDLQTAAGQQSTRRETIAVARGTIYDRYGQPLVNRTNEITVAVAPFAECVSLMETALKGLDRSRVLEELRRGDCATVTVDGWLSPTVGVTQIRAPRRYDTESTACHIIGYINADGEGVNGVEKAYDELLSSYNGEASVTYSVDALGRVAVDAEPLLTNELSRATGGVALTLDSEIQRLVRQAAVSYLERGAVVVTNVQNGELLACTSVPVYDPRDVEAVLDDTASPLLDRARTNYDLGSVFKLITAAAALENGFSAGKTYTCEGAVAVDGIRFHCHNPLGDGVQTMREAMANSCNCYFIQLACDVGASAVYELAVRAGFADTLTLTAGMQTACAVLPSRRDLSADAALANFAIGQGELLATPYHIAALYGAVVADGVITKPSLFYGTVDEHGVLTKDPSTPETVRLFSPQTASALRGMLEQVVISGTGTAAAPAERQAAGKTGTAQTGWKVDGEEVVQSWFAGYYPADDPQYVITVLSENGGANGIPAAPLFAAIADELFYAGLVE